MYIYIYMYTYTCTYVYIHIHIYIGGASVTFGLDGSVLIRSGSKQRKGSSIGINPGNLTDPDFFLRFLTVPLEENPHNFVK
jgi:hypothetical protein